jgi:ABC-2 type transport system permease protein
VSLWRLEWLRLVRTKRLVALVGVYLFFGLLGPLTTRYLGEIIRRFGGNVQVVLPDPVPADGIAAFAGDAQQIGLLVAVVVAAGALALDALPEMSIFLRSRVRPAGRLLWPRLAVSMLAAFAGFLIGLAAAWYETVVLLGGVRVGALLVGAGYGLLYLGFAVTVVAAIAAHSRSVVVTAALSLLSLALLAIPGLVPAVGVWLPGRLVGALDDLVRGGGIVGYLRSAGVTVLVSAGLAAWAAKAQAGREV